MVELAETIAPCGDDEPPPAPTVVKLSPLDPHELSVEELLARVQKVKDIQATAMKEGVHYGRVPGIEKPSLFKPGAELLALAFRLAATFEATERFEGPHFLVRSKCILRHIPTGQIHGEGDGLCSSREAKHAWRRAPRLCLVCGKPKIIRSKFEDCGWVCFDKAGGCGAKFPADSPGIVNQVAGRVPNEDIADTYNTVLKMADKRAHVAAILFVTCASEVFTQDVEDMPMVDDEEKAQPQRGGARGKAAPREQRPARPVAVEKLLERYKVVEELEPFMRLDEERAALWGKVDGKPQIDGKSKRALKAASEAAAQRIKQAHAGKPREEKTQEPAPAAAE